MAGDVWYYAVDGAQQGPVNAGRLKELATAGQLQPTDLIWKEGAPSWVAASTVKGLFPAANILGMEEAYAPPPQEPRTRGSELGDQARAAGQDALAAIKILASNPVGGIGEAHDRLGPARAMLVGGIFIAVFYLVFVLANSLGEVTRYGRAFDFGNRFWRNILIGLIAPGGLILGCLLVRKLFRGTGTFASDVFITGASLLPITIVLLLLWPSTLYAKAFGYGLAGDLVNAIEIFGLACAILLLNSGVTKIMKISEAVTAIAVPLMVIVAFTITSLFSRMIAPSSVTGNPQADEILKRLENLR